MVDVLEGGATVEWRGDLDHGEGRLRLGLGAGGEVPVRWPRSASSSPAATNPEELAAASHAACFTMTLADTLVRRRHPARAIAVEATTTFGTVAGTRAVSRSELEIIVDADGLSESELEHALEIAGRYCPVSNTFRLAGAELVAHGRLAPESSSARARA
jgi:osmotically inducible protein OsmC